MHTLRSEIGSSLALWGVCLDVGAAIVLTVPRFCHADRIGRGKGWKLGSEFIGLGPIWKGNDRKLGDVTTGKLQNGLLTPEIPRERRKHLKMEENHPQNGQKVPKFRAEFPRSSPEFPENSDGPGEKGFYAI